jgi:DNA polymerase III delta prime subunit
MSKTFTVKYKPYYIRDFFMDENFTVILNALKKIDDLNILFIGGENSGKTSFLYALIRDYYGIDKDEPLPYTEIMFINNLKEQGINYFRSEMKTFCKSKCSIFGKKKLVILDDMDSINEHSQQVFRNYIDKHSGNVNFIGVCSSIQKIIESVQSRLHIMHIHSLNNNQISNILQKIIKTEDIYIDEASCDYILCISENNIRNVINNLEKLYIYGSTPDNTIDINICKRICSNISFRKFEEFIIAVRNDKIDVPIHILYDMHNDGYSVIDILDYFFTFVKITNLLTEIEKYETIPLICKYITIFNKIHEDPIELALFANEISKILQL